MTETEVHNCYTLYELNEDGSKAENPLLCFSRPQDWGDPERWKYHYCKLEVAGYINHCHLWQEVERYPTEACKVISQALFMIMMPGTPQELCDRSHLHGDDFWLKEWGEMPPYYDEDPSDFDFLEEEQEAELIPPGGNLYCWRVWHPQIEDAIAEAQINPLPDPPFPTAALLYTLKSDGKGGHNMKDEGESDLPTTGFLFGTHESEEQKLSPNWIQRGWQIEEQPSMQRIG